MTSRAILSSGFAVCLRCQLRSSGVLPYRRSLPLIRRGIPSSFIGLRWHSNGLQNQPEQSQKMMIPAEPPSPRPPLGTASIGVNSLSTLTTSHPTNVDAPPTPITENLSASGFSATSTALHRNTSILGAVDLFPPLPTRKRPGLPQLENRKLLILEMPTKRQRKQTVSPPLTEVAAEEVASLSSYLLVFEDKADTYQLAIEITKPTELRVSRLRFQQITDQLSSQFLKSQLSSYVNYIHELGGTPPAKSTDSKGWLITRILKDLWKIEISEEIHEREDLIVEKKTIMSKEDIFFLIGQNGNNLRTWAQEHHARITINLRDSTLGIEATMVNIEELEKQIPELLGDKIYEDINLTPLTRLTGFNKAYIPTISKLTGTFIQQLVEDVYRVSTLRPNTALLEDARRLMFDSHEIPFRTTYSLLVDSQYSTAAASQGYKCSLFRIAADASLAWVARGKDWSRWRTVKEKIPVEHDKSPSQQKFAALIKQFVPSPDYRKPIFLGPENSSELKLLETEPSWDIEALYQLLDNSISEEERQHLDLLPQPEYTATLGYVLHSTPGQSEQSDTLDQVLGRGNERVFYENIPGLTYLHTSFPLVTGNGGFTEPMTAFPGAIALPEFDIDPGTGEAVINTGAAATDLIDPAKHYILLRLFPSPWKHDDSFESFPPVEMELEIDPKTGDLSNPKVVAVQSDAVADLMLPGRECDVRFRRRVVVPLYMPQPRSALETEVGAANQTNFGVEDRAVGVGVAEEVAMDITEKDAADITEKSTVDSVEGSIHDVTEGTMPTKVTNNDTTKRGTKDTTHDSSANPVKPHLPDQSSMVLNYLAKSKLNPNTNDRLQPAAELTLLIPHYLCSPSPDPCGSPTDASPVTYAFTSISYVTNTCLNGTYYLNKKTMESGLSGGKKAVLDVELRRVGKPDMEGTAPEWSSWAEVVLGLVTKLGNLIGQPDKKWR